MLNKFIAFGLMVAPTTASAGSQSQSNVQTSGQNSAATDGSTTAQSSSTLRRQLCWRQRAAMYPHK
ncbi:MAG: hypothetical protein PUP91_02325 [Rhizonema sp. PD37]|nr:hypothetical protein [Rhizonema sp. PD37]